MATLHLQLLGAFEARLDDGPARLVSARKAQALLAYLAMNPGRPHPRQRLADLLWGLSGDAHARNSLRQTLFVIRRELDGFAGLVARGDDLSLDPRAYRSDVLDLERLAEDNAVPATGELLDGLTLREPAFQEWLEAERRRCRDLVQMVLLARLSHLEEQGAVAPAIEAARRLLALDPLQEDVHRALIRLYVSQGRHGDAARQYEHCREILRQEFGIRPAPATRQVLGIIETGGRAIGAPAGPPEGPATVVAVAPFTCETDERKLTDYAARLLEDTTANLTAWRLFPVISRRAVLAATDAADWHRAIRDLGASHIVDGTVRRIGGRLRVTVALVDAATGRNAWSSRFDDRLDGRDEIANRIAGTVASTLEQIELLRPTPDVEPVDAWGFWRRGKLLLTRSTKEANTAARAMFERAIDLDPTFVRAHAGLAWTYCADHTQAYVEDRALAYEHCAAAARRAIDLDASESEARATLSATLRGAGDFDLAIMELERAVALNPSDGHVLGVLGHTLDAIGRPADGLVLIRHGLDLGLQGHDRAAALWQVARAALNARDNGAAVDAARRSIHCHWTHPQPYLHLASSLGHLGKRREARAALQACEDISPGFSRLHDPCYAKRSDQEHYFDVLCAAGW